MVDTIIKAKHASKQVVEHKIMHKNHQIRLIVKHGKCRLFNHVCNMVHEAMACTMTS